MFSAFTEECLAAPFTDQIFHFIIPALADTQAAFPFEPFLDALLAAESGGARAHGHAPWLFYFVLTVGENYLGMKRGPVYPCAPGSVPEGGPEEGGSRHGTGCPGQCPAEVPAQRSQQVPRSGSLPRSGSMVTRIVGVTWGSSPCAKLVMFWIIASSSNAF